MRLLITVGVGYIGSHVIRILENKKAAIYDDLFAVDQENKVAIENIFKHFKLDDVEFCSID